MTDGDGQRRKPSAKHTPTRTALQREGERIARRPAPKRARKRARPRERRKPLPGKVLSVLTERLEAIGSKARVRGQQKESTIKRPPQVKNLELTRNSSTVKSRSFPVRLH